jgi:hypothetical protein
MATIKSSTEHLTLNADGASKDIKFQANGVEKASISSAGVMTATSFAGDGSALTGTGKVLQIVNFQTGAVATGTTLFPYDTSIPQNTEGDEYMTLAITPVSATSKLKIEINAIFAHSSSTVMGGALFQDTTANALATSVFQTTGDTYRHFMSFNHNMTSGTTSATTFKFRLGGLGAGTTSFNGSSSFGYYGGTLASSITITEYEV